MNKQQYIPQVAVNCRRDNTQYFNLNEINKPKLFAIIDAAEKRNKAWLDFITEDPFIELMQKRFDAKILLPMRKKHMVVIFGEKITDKKLISDLKQFFEVQIVVNDWDGEQEIDDNQATLLITEKKPPFAQPYKLLSIDGAKRLLAT